MTPPTSSSSIAPTFRVDHMPYGGVKESGTGREGIKYAIEEMTEMKSHHHKAYDLL
jgi:acyl-CoA reductase-like NAD-dependent aldehyde dehydrogenase